ncbi:TPA: hypothetical protein G8L57_001390 [Salmonella enterica]|uniref:Transmembrane protein n=6 Tax=Salmonella enterica TaxID=28901 RepID=A0A5V0ZYS7_SALER|nr:hypothetical protein [Salmonella enterica subsp. enterica serovar Muenster]EAA7317710.1 hypothetical protein [Salmonella enterica subsp. enterica]EAA8606524.1 hypothetical protein [Salmonella enterica]EAB7442689.1 hypothetical protein [Salmonella enterica subsp. enterica serovar Anatum]EAS0626569.1 hypothetical protein [Salmonella enterica subsp. enterica serovar Amager]EBC9965872.1 hypothetical protein [Salmonella enterica subsp. enterica serovar Kentucky]EBF9769540.1 hypothetical protein
MCNQRNEAVGLEIDTILSYSKERYEEVKATYRRLEDKANFLLAVLGVEISALLAVFGSFELGQKLKTSLSARLSLLCLCSCFVCLVVCFYYLWKSWELRNIPKMPVYRTAEQHDFLLKGNRDNTVRFHLIMYRRAIDSIEKIHKEKSAFVNELFRWMAMSFVFFIISVTCMLINKV